MTLKRAYPSDYAHYIFEAKDFFIMNALEQIRGPNLKKS
jgi:hypothetical protein